MIKDYIYDGTFEGLLTTIYYSYLDKDEVNICRLENHIPTLFSEIINVTTDSEIFEKVYRSTLKKLSTEVLRNIYYLYLSEIDGCENLIYSYYKLCFKCGVSINLAKNNDTIIAVDTMVHKVNLEVHRFTGFVRFQEIRSLVFYSPIEPDHNIVSLLSTHFVDRFRDQYFIIHDTKRASALIYNKEEAYLRDFTSHDQQLLLSQAKDDAYADLFKTFFNSVNIKERYNPSYQARSMPKRYWKNLSEYQ
ncbi:MAG: hypothetical protein K0R15_1772 [Clostridiales bacterium]|jgi:probable DNA metabolism protein|nr:hypothetical protein [Clostridiales bacterium]